MTTIAAIAACAATAPAAAAVPRFLTGPNAGDPEAIALGHLTERRQALGLSAADLADLEVTDRVVDADTRTTHLYLRQRIAGIGVADGVGNISVDRAGRVITLGDRFLRDLRAKAGPQAARLSPADGVRAAARAVGARPPGRLRVRQGPRGAAQRTTFAPAGSSARPIDTELRWVRADGGRLRLAWNVELLPDDAARWWLVDVDARTGEELDREDLISHAGADVVESSAYTAFAPPVEAPTFGARSVLTSPFDRVASPFGWHDTDGVLGAESTRTVGNNVQAAQPVRDGSRWPSTPDLTTAPDGGTGLTFDHELDLAKGPGEYVHASITNLFVWNNHLHDVLHRQGFDEDAGNFQTTNRGLGGQGGDPVIALARHPSLTGNFGTPAEGRSPVMYTGINSDAGPTTIKVGTSTFTPAEVRKRPEGAAEITAPGALVDDGAGTPTDGCTDFVDFPAGAIALITAGRCFLGAVVDRAQDADAAGVIVLQPSSWGIYAGTEIPVVVLHEADGTALRDALPTDITLSFGAPRHADSALDNSVVAHEYGHGLSNRLVGGPSDVSCLGNAEQMGEGWSDFLALLATATGGGPAQEARPVGTFFIFEPATGGGVRGGPYSTDLAMSPWVYDDIKRSSQSHFVGMRWNAALWEVHWQLVRAHGWAADLTGEWRSAGNVLALRLLVDSLKLTPCSPGFVDGRDAFLLADRNLTGGENECRIWRGFAKRGLGFSAEQGSSSSTTDGTQAFDLPASCVQVADDAASTDLDTPVEVGAPGVLGNDSDITAGTHRPEVVDGPQHGTLVLRDDGSFTYTPREDHIGADAFTYRVADGSSTSGTATVRLTVRAACDGRTPTIVGTPVGEALHGTPGPDVVLALGGDDRVAAVEGDDVVCAGSGADVVHADRGNAAEGADVVFGGSGDDHLLGGPGNDRLHGGGGADAVFGGRGDDRLDGGEDAPDRCQGDQDTDTATAGCEVLHSVP